VGDRFGYAAVPPPVRKAFGFPSGIQEWRGLASGGVAAKESRADGKPEAFRTGGGKAA